MVTEATGDEGPAGAGPSTRLGPGYLTELQVRFQSLFHVSRTPWTAVPFSRAFDDQIAGMAGAWSTIILLTFAHALARADGSVTVLAWSIAAFTALSSKTAQLTL